MALNIESYPGGCSVQVQPELTHISEQTVASINTGINNIINEQGIQDDILNAYYDGYGLRNTYKGGYNGPIISFVPKYDSVRRNAETEVIVTHGKKWMSFGYDLKLKKITEVNGHNFDKICSNYVTDWMNSTVHESIKNVQEEKGLKWVKTVLV